MRFGLGIISRMMIFICSGGGMRLTLAFVTIFGLYGSWVDAQRLSQGASDWYMRFYSNMDYVKRNVDGPVTKSFVVSSEVKFRYAVTTITVVVHNPANVEQPYNFGLVMPKNALVSNATIVRRLLKDGVAMDNDDIVVHSFLNMSQLVLEDNNGSLSKLSDDDVATPLR